jgi:hypothetical protein
VDSRKATENRSLSVGGRRRIPLDAAERKRYHTEQARLAEKEQQWFAIAFHVGRLLLDTPDDVELQRRRDEALRLQAAVGALQVRPPPMEKAP